MAKAKNRRTCWCPCQCGCMEPDAVINESGLCPDCEGTNHEVPPEGVKPSVEELLKLHRSIVRQYAAVLRRRKVGART